MTYITRAAYAVKESAQVFFLLTRSNPSQTILMNLHTYDHIMVYKITVENFVRIVCTVFAKIEKGKKWLFFAIFGLIWRCFSHPSHTILLRLRTQGPLWV